MSEKATLTGLLSDFSNSVQNLIAEISGQKQRFVDLADQVSSQLATAKQHVSDMSASLFRSIELERDGKKHVDDAQQYAKNAEDHSTAAADKSYLAGQHELTCNQIATNVANQITVAAQHVETARQHSVSSEFSRDESADNADRSERARDESYLAVSGLAAEMQELKRLVIETNGIA